MHTYTIYFLQFYYVYTMHVESKHFKYIGTYPFQAPETLRTHYLYQGRYNISCQYYICKHLFLVLPPSLPGTYLYTNNFFYFLHIMHLNSSATHLQGSTRLRIYPTVFFREKPSFQFQGCRKNLPGFSHVGIERGLTFRPPDFIKMRTR